MADSATPTETDNAAGAYQYAVELDADEPWDDDDPQGYFVTAVTAGEGAAVGAVRFIHSRDGERVVLTGDIWVDPAHRRSGVATGMMRHLREATSKLVDPNGFTPAGLALWNSLGWKADFTSTRTPPLG